ncbi:MAG: CBS domain-containing protein [Chitinophagales bacterium]
MATVHKILEKKGRAPYTIAPQITVFEALREMVEKNVGALIVMDGETFRGLFTERDYARKVMLRDRTSRDTYVHEILDNDYFTVTVSTPISDCMNIMTENSIRYLPVLDNGKLIGVISIGDVVKHIIEEQQFTLDQMQSYIHER